MKPKYDFSGQVSLVTGAASGLGRATAKAFAESDAAVVLVDRDKEKLTALLNEITGEGGKAIMLPGETSPLVKGNLGPSAAGGPAIGT